MMPVKQLFTKEQKLKYIGYTTVFNNKHNPYRIVSYKWTRNDKFKPEKLTAGPRYRSLALN